MGYIEELRALVGHRPLILAGAAVLIVDNAARVLLQRRADNGTWGLPGGFMQPGEYLEETARREVREEVGLDVGELSLLGVFAGPELYKKYANGDEVFIVCAAYVTCDVKGELYPNPSEAVDAKFFELSALPNEINPPDKPMLARFINDLRTIQSLMTKQSKGQP
ncbi:NUDIX hydrolase [Candidatus Acetothermia bacterium]|nr:NUDIX hydrolase [Candidatus Acetothermia bacterium]